ncbi:MAG: Holliday junction branch migration protein RuvA [Actinomycetales bacterium]|nr:Holliday junction branch migration protein RuvA [Actinomycetales bacterium]
MIAFLRGAVASASPDGVVIDVGGVGIAAACTPATALGLRPGDHVELVTSLVVREDGWTLYGFVDADERRVFELVQTVSGIGPRLALGLLATLTPDALRSAVASEDLATLTRVPGIGRKGAARLVLELKDRLGQPASAVAASPLGAGWQAAVIAGLTSLGWSAKEAERAAQSVAPMAEEQASPDIPVLLKAALRSLDRS